MKTLAISEVAKINEVLEMSEKEVMAIKKQFASVHMLDKKTAIVKDWLDDSIQLIKIKEEKKESFRCSCCNKEKDSRVLKMRKWNNGKTEVGICGTCNLKITFHGYKTVLGYLNK